MSLVDRLSYLSQGAESLSGADLRGDWVDAIGDLFRWIKEFAEPHVKNNLLSLIEGKVAIEEERLGYYEAPTLDLRSGPKSVLLRPAARIVAGCTGRIDVFVAHNQIGAQILRFGMGRDTRWFAKRPETLNALLFNQWFERDEETGRIPEAVPLTRSNLEQLLDILFA